MPFAAPILQLEPSSTFRDKPSKLSGMADHKVAIFVWFDWIQLRIVGIEEMHRAISFFVQPRCLLLIGVLSIFLILALSGTKWVWSFSLFIWIVDLVRIIEPDFNHIVWSVIEFGTKSLMGFRLNLILLIEWVVPMVWCICNDMFLGMDSLFEDTTVAYV